MRFLLAVGENLPDALSSSHSTDSSGGE